MRLVDQQTFENLHALELAAFQTVCMRSLQASKTRLLSVWFTEAQRIFYNGSKKRLVPKMRDKVRRVLWSNSRPGIC